MKQLMVLEKWIISCIEKVVICKKKLFVVLQKKENKSY